MGLSGEERDKIVEEETLRQETRQRLAHGGHGCCHRGHRGRPWLWLLAGLVLGWALGASVCRRACGWGGGGHCAWGGGMAGRHCPMPGMGMGMGPMEGGMMPAPEAAPARPAKPAKP